MRPMWDEIEKTFPELITEYYEADDNEELLKKYKIEDIPSFIFLDGDDNEVSRLQGVQNKDGLESKVREFLDK